MRIPRVAVVIAYTAICFAQNGIAHKSNGKILNVCEALSQRDRYNGKMVYIRGVINGNMHGAWIVGKHCGRCLINLPANVPCAIYLASPGQATEPVEFTNDDEAARRVRAFFRQHGEKARNREQIVTYFGLLEAKADHDLGNIPGATRIFGFGPNGAFAAQLVVKTQLDPEVGEEIKQ